MHLVKSFVGEPRTRKLISAFKLSNSSHYRTQLSQLAGLLAQALLYVQAIGAMIDRSCNGAPASTTPLGASSGEYLNTRTRVTRAV
jgi:hypothetical protein